MLLDRGWEQIFPRFAPRWFLIMMTVAVAVVVAVVVEVHQQQLLLAVWKYRFP